MGVITEKEKQKYFAYLDGVADGLNESRNDVNSILDKISSEIEQNAYPIVHGVNNHEKGMTLYGILQIIDKYKVSNKK